MKRRAMMMSSKKEYIQFVDPEVERLCIANWSSDGIGVTMADAAAVTTLSTYFQSNATIEYFDELQYFTGLTAIYGAGGGTNCTGAFLNCTNLKSVTMPNTIITIGQGAFKGCTSLVSCPLPTSIKTIGEQGFWNCALQEDVNLPNLTSLSRFGFYGSGITKISNLGSITTTGTHGTYGTFQACSHLTEVTLPSTLTTIGEQAFVSCTALTKVVFPNRSVSVGAHAFRYCSALVNIGQPQISSLGSRVFQSCTSIASLDFSQSTFPTISGTSAGGGCQGCTNLETVILPSTCTTLSHSSFKSCSKLATINLENVVTVATQAFDGAKLTGEFNLSKATVLDSYCFRSCKITKVFMPKLTQTYGTSGTTNSGSFGGNSQLTYVDIGPNCTQIGYRTFQNCSSLQIVICRATSVPTMQSSVFANTNSTFKIYVPYSSDHSILAAYQAATQWSTYASRIYELDQDGNIPT